jgi:hypothetical protein
MERDLLGEGVRNGTSQADRKDGLEARVLRGQLVSLTLDWELAALALDAQRYRVPDCEERENLRDSAAAYRKCIAELTQVLAGSSLLACKPQRKI